MDTLKTAYRILKNLEDGNRDKYMGLLLSPEALGVSPEEWKDVILSLVEEEYIRGVSVKENVLGETMIDIGGIKITLKGAEYLKENSVMKKLADVMTNVITIAKP